MYHRAKKQPVALGRPTRLTEEHELEGFSCDEASLDDFLRSKALKNMKSKASITYVVCERDSLRVVAYYTLSSGAVGRADAPGNVSRGMPDPIPVTLLGRLAVDSRYKGLGIGKGLLKDALERSTIASQEIGARALLVHAIDDVAAAFYSKHGFVESTVTPMTLMTKL